jgi:hypothetical protein
MRCSAAGAAIPPARLRSENCAEGNIALRHIVESPRLIGAGTEPLLPSPINFWPTDREQRARIIGKRRGNFWFNAFERVPWLPQ